MMLHVSYEPYVLYASTITTRNKMIILSVERWLVGGIILLKTIKMLIIS